jgi:hypothetical protein
MQRSRYSGEWGAVAAMGADILGLVPTSPATAQTASSPPGWRRRPAATS